MPHSQLLSPSDSLLSQASHAGATENDFLIDIRPMQYPSRSTCSFSTLKRKQKIAGEVKGRAAQILISAFFHSGVGELGSSQNIEGWAGVYNV